MLRFLTEPILVRFLRGEGTVYFCVFVCAKNKNKTHVLLYIYTRILTKFFFFSILPYKIYIVFRWNCVCEYKDLCVYNNIYGVLTPHNSPSFASKIHLLCNSGLSFNVTYERVKRERPRSLCSLGLPCNYFLASCEVNAFCNLCNNKNGSLTLFKYFSEEEDSSLLRLTKDIKSLLRLIVALWYPYSRSFDWLFSSSIRLPFAKFAFSFCSKAWRFSSCILIAVSHFCPSSFRFRV